MEGTVLYALFRTVIGTKLTFGTDDLVRGEFSFGTITASSAST